MLEEFEHWAFLLVFFAYITIWARINTLIEAGHFGIDRILRQLSYRIMGMVGIDYDQVYHLLESSIYYSGGILGILAFNFIYKDNILNYVYLDRIYIGILITGALAEISLTGIINGFWSNFARSSRINIIDEISKIKWILAISSLPKSGMLLAAALGGFLEEIIFRGIFLIVAINYYRMDASVALILSILLFMYDQIIQLDTLAQMYIIGSTSLIISIIGGLMVLYTGSILPAVVAHTSFVIFYMSTSQKPRSM